jgi:hypothetical protein
VEVVVEVKRALQGARRRYKAVQMTSICLLVADGECMGRADVIESAGPPLKGGVVGVELASNQDVAPSGAQIVAAAQASALWAGMFIPPGRKQVQRAFETQQLHCHEIVFHAEETTTSTCKCHGFMKKTRNTQCSRTLAMLIFWSYFEAYGLTRDDRSSPDLRIVFLWIHRTSASCGPIPEFYNPNAFACSSGYPSTTKKIKSQKPLQ